MTITGLQATTTGAKTMQKQRIYNLGKNKFEISYQVTPNNQDAILDLTDSGWVDHKYSLFKALSKHHNASIWNNDLIGRDDYIESLGRHTVYLVFTNSKLTASKLRLRTTYKRLKEAGIKCKYFASSDSLNKFLNAA